VKLLSSTPRTLSPASPWNSSLKLIGAGPAENSSLATIPRHPNLQFESASAIKKTVALSIFFLTSHPVSPHAWLNITCPKTKMGRITNYAALNGDMVPDGKTCLCWSTTVWGRPVACARHNQLADLASTSAPDSECSMQLNALIKWLCDFWRGRIPKSAHLAHQSPCWRSWPN